MRGPFPKAIRVLALGLAVLAGLIGTGAASPSPAAAAPSEPSVDIVSVPLLAYYYIWFDAASWDRAKSDLPVLGPYSSDDEAVVRQHIKWAKAAGIDGFIVSWKNTAVLDRRLDTLVRVAADMAFKLEIIYEGLDFARAPLAPTLVAEDLDFFIAHYAGNPVFDLFDKPLVIWSGTWEFSPTDVAAVVGPRRDRLRILASERSVAGFARLGDSVDGNAYYWSSVNPDTSPNYGDKLTSMGAAVHDAAGLWIAPAAPGFDARLLGGTTVVDRQAGKMLQGQLATAVASFPDAVGLISWNEFSENSEVEPSRAYGDTSLKVLGDARKTNYASLGDFDSSAPQGIDLSAGLGRAIAIGLVLGSVLAGLILSFGRRKAQR